MVRFLLSSSDTPVLRIALQEILLMPVQEVRDSFGDGNYYSVPGRTRYRIRWSRLERMLEAASRPISELLNSPSDDGEEPAGAEAASSSPSALSSGETLDLMLTYVLSENGRFLREALIEDVLGALEDANLVVLRGLSLLTGGLLPPPSAYPDQDRLAVIGQLLSNLRKLALDRGGAALESPSALVGAAGSGGLSLSTVQAQALADLARQVLAAYAERQAQSAVRRVFHGVERVIHSQQRPVRRGGQR